MIQQDALPEKERGPSFFGKLLRRVDGCDLKLVFDDKPDDQMITVDDLYGNASERMRLYAGKEPVRGRAMLTPSGSSYAHNGILIELVGTVVVQRSEESTVEFLRQERRFEADTLTQPTPFEFQFAAPKVYESYRGMNADVSYVLRVTVKRPMKNISAKEEIWVSCVDDELSASQPDASAHKSYFRETVFGPQSTHMDVGVEDLLHIEFRYDKAVFHLSERILGKVTFKNVVMDIQYGEVGIVRKEFIGSGKADDAMEAETLQKFEIMDGTPIVGEVVPIRLYLGSIPRLTPTYANVHNCFRVLYFVNLVLVTDEGKRYYKQQEIQLYRRKGQEIPATNNRTQADVGKAQAA